MERHYGQARRVWAMDRGMASAGTIAWLRDSQRRYLIGASESELKTFAGADRRDWRQVRDGVEAKICAGPDGSETFLLVRSAERQQKEQAMHARFCERIETALASCNDALSGRKSRSTGAPPSVRSDACSAATPAPPRATRSVSSTTKSCRLACGSNGRGAPNGTTGRVTAKAATCCAPI
jgi:hypothetical protein